LGRHNADVWDTALHRLIAFREAGNEHRFFDISFADMQTDPMGTIGRLYDWLGEDLSPHAERRMAAWWNENSKERHGAQRYRAEDFGIDVDQLRERFLFYTDRFGVTPEQASS